MKSLIYSLALLAVMVIGSCKKSDSLADLVVGKWQLVSTYVGIGGGNTTYQPVTTNSYIRFNSDGSLSGNTFPGYTTYKVNQSTIVFSGPGTSFTNAYSFTDGLLQLNGLNCIEGCGQRFQKVP